VGPAAALYIRQLRGDFRSGQVSGGGTVSVSDGEVTLAGSGDESDPRPCYPTRGGHICTVPPREL
jgi:hypothetical protein